MFSIDLNLKQIKISRLTYRVINYMRHCPFRLIDLNILDYLRLFLNRCRLQSCLLPYYRRHRSLKKIKQIYLLLVTTQHNDSNIQTNKI